MRSTRSLVLFARHDGVRSSGLFDPTRPPMETRATSDAPTTDATTYVDGVCTALGDWKTGLDDDNEQLQSARSAGQPTPEDTKTALVDLPTATVDGTKAMISDIEALGSARHRQR